LLLQSGFQHAGGTMATSIPTTVQAGTKPEVKLDRLFVPVDFSTLSDRAVDYARRIAGRHGAEILLAHVSQPLSPMAVPEAAWYHLEAAQNKELARLERMGAKLRSEGLKARTVSLNGLLQDEIPCCSKNECSDLIVLGAQINSGIERLLFGCDSEVLFRHAGCPVLVIGPETRPAPDRPWLLENVICATDLRPESASAAAFAWRLAQKYEAAFTLLHVEPRTPKPNADHQSRFAQAVARTLPEAENPANSLQTMPCGHDSCATAIVALARKQHSDLIVMGAQACSHAATRLLRGTAAQVVADSPCPVLVLNVS
jgi:nucleotide-binding universal stress UspA family protein